MVPCFRHNHHFPLYPRTPGAVVRVIIKNVAHATPTKPPQVHHPAPPAPPMNFLCNQIIYLQLLCIRRGEQQQRNGPVIIPLTTFMARLRYAPEYVWLCTR